MPTRFTYIFGFVTIALLLGTSIYLQFYDGFIPCPLCTLQRIVFGLLGMLFLLGIFLPAKRIGYFLLNALISLTALLGALLAGRQIWLQHFPPSDGSECGVSLQYMLQVLPLNEVAKKIFQGTAECTQIGWQFLHLNMAEWSLIWFVGFLFLGLFLVKSSLRQP